MATFGKELLIWLTCSSFYVLRMIVFLNASHFGFVGGTVFPMHSFLVTAYLYFEGC